MDEEEKGVGEKEKGMGEDMLGTYLVIANYSTVFLAVTFPDYDDRQDKEGV